jgi:hypothetical protein
LAGVASCDPNLIGIPGARPALAPTASKLSQHWWKSRILVPRPAVPHHETSDIDTSLSSTKRDCKETLLLFNFGEHYAVPSVLMKEGDSWTSKTRCNLRLNTHFPNRNTVPRSLTQERIIRHALQLTAFRRGQPALPFTEQALSRWRQRPGSALVQIAVVIMGALGQGRCARVR